MSALRLLASVEITSKLPVIQKETGSQSFSSVPPFRSRDYSHLAGPFLQFISEETMIYIRAAILGGLSLVVLRAHFSLPTVSSYCAVIQPIHSLHREMMTAPKKSRSQARCNELQKNPRVVGPRETDSLLPRIAPVQPTLPYAPRRHWPVRASHRRIPDLMIRTEFFSRSNASPFVSTRCGGPGQRQNCGYSRLLHAKSPVSLGDGGDSSCMVAGGQWIAFLVRSRK